MRLGGRLELLIVCQNGGLRKGFVECRASELSEDTAVFPGSFVALVKHLGPRLRADQPNKSCALFRRTDLG